MTEFESQLTFCVPWTCHLTSLCLNVLIWKTGISTALIGVVRGLSERLLRAVLIANENTQHTLTIALSLPSDHPPAHASSTLPTN